MSIVPLKQSAMSSGARNAGPWRTAMACEWRLVCRDAAAWLAAALMLVCGLLAVATGVQRADDRHAAVQAAQQDEGQRRTGLASQLRRIESGEAAVPRQAFRDPTNPMTVGRSRSAGIVHLADSPLTSTAIGLSDLHPAVMAVQAGSPDRFLFAEELANPTLQAAGGFDLAFVIVYLLPLVLLVLACDVLSAEREGGTWALHLASSARPWPVLAGKLLVRCAPAVLALLLALPAALIAGSRVPDTAFTAGAASVAGAAWVLTVLLYAAFWLALALWVNSWGRSSSFNAMALFVAWVGLVLVVPALVTAAAQAVWPAPSRSEVVQAVREATVDAERDRAADQARYNAEHAAAPRGAQRQALDLLVSADARARSILLRHETQVRQHQTASALLALASPPLRVQAALVELAGHGPVRRAGFNESVLAFHHTWQDHFAGLARSGEAFRKADLERLPAFADQAADTWRPEAVWRLLQTWVLLITLGAAAALAAKRRLLAADWGEA